MYVRVCCCGNLELGTPRYISGAGSPVIHRQRQASQVGIAYSRSLVQSITTQGSPLLVTSMACCVFSQ
jgi:hypothetical protein